jgi:hypothetical protein
MKQKLLQTFILIVFMVVYQSYEQRLEAATIIDKATTDELSSKVKEEGGVIKTQEGGWMNSPEYEGLSYAEKLNRRADELARRRFKEQEEAAKQAQIEQAVASRNAILTYGSIGIALLFIIIAIAAFSILYVRRNNDNPKYRKP